MATEGGVDFEDLKRRMEGALTTLHSEFAGLRTGRASAIDGRTTRYPGYAISQRLRKRVEEIFGWMKTVGNFRKTRHRGIERVGWMFTLTATAYNLVRMRNLAVAASP